mmetsp:Transcript_13547/g.39016  ORF Transcript_13547/g.39016 Transcript_13547/m.39016 type:complete len:372 (-) Transcript_13547:3199-4314(-)
MYVNEWRAEANACGVHNDDSCPDGDDNLYCEAIGQSSELTAKHRQPDAVDHEEHIRTHARAGKVLEEQRHENDEPSAHDAASGGHQPNVILRHARPLNTAVQRHRATPSDTVHNLTHQRKNRRLPHRRLLDHVLGGLVLVCSAPLLLRFLFFRDHREGRCDKNKKKRRDGKLKVAGDKREAHKVLKHLDSLRPHVLQIDYVGEVQNHDVHPNPEKTLCNWNSPILRICNEERHVVLRCSLAIRLLLPLCPHLLEIWSCQEAFQLCACIEQWRIVGALRKFADDWSNEWHQLPCEAQLHSGGFHDVPVRNVICLTILAPCRVVELIRVHSSALFDQESADVPTVEPEPKTRGQHRQRSFAPENPTFWIDKAG